jgi:hypothetical protein
VRVFAVKPHGPPFYESVSYGGLPLPDPKSAQEMVRDLNLGEARYPYAAFVKGTVRDQESGMRLTGSNAQVGPYARLVDAEGEYFNMVLLAAPTQVVDAQVYFHAAPPTGLAYQLTPRQVTLTSGRTAVVDFNLPRISPPTGVVGRVTNSRTGEPLAYARARLSLQYASVICCPPRTGTGSSTVTDALGRFAMPAPVVHESAVVSQATIYTNGFFGPDSESPYQPLTKDVTGQLIDRGGKVRTGEVVQVDCAVVPK